ERGDLRAEAAGFWRLVDDCHPAGFLRAAGDLLDVERPERSQIDYLAADPLFRRAVGGEQCLVDHRAPGDDAHVLSFPHYPRLAERDLVVLLRNLSFGRPVDSLRLKKEYRIRVSHRREQQTLGVVRGRRGNYLQAGGVDEERFGALRVVVAA